MKEERKGTGGPLFNNNAVLYRGSGELIPQIKKP
jgi:hypothetical protein